MQSEQNPWKTIEKEVAYENPWIRVEHRDVLNPSGGKGIYGVVHFKNTAIGILPIDEDGNTWLVGQYRYPTDSYSWEIPEGGGPLGIEPLDSAKRELREETGLVAGHWEKLMTMHVSNCVSDEVAIIYIARNLTQGEAQPEETEQLKIKKLPLAEAIQMAIDGDITDSMSVATLLKARVLGLG